MLSLESTFVLLRRSNGIAFLHHNLITMWSTNSLWFEVSLVSILILLGHIFLGHFEERSPRWRKLVKYVIALAIVITLSISFGRAVALITLFVSLIPVIYIHAVLLPRKGINGWTGEPKSKYYEFRGWDKNIFNSGNRQTVRKVD